VHARVGSLDSGRSGGIGGVGGQKGVVGHGSRGPTVKSCVFEVVGEIFARQLRAVEGGRLTTFQERSSSKGS
jgi:hypothetical protein